MSTELTLFIVTMVVVNLLVMGVVLAVPAQRRSESARASGAASGTTSARSPAPEQTGLAKYFPGFRLRAGDEGASEIGAPPPATHDRILRILWWLTIASVLIGVGLSGAYPQTQPYIFAVGGLGVALVFVLHDLIPDRWIGPFKFALEGLLATAFITGLLTLTDYGSSPYFFGYYLIAVGVAVTLGRRATVVYAAVAGLSYLLVLYLDPRAGSFTSADLLRFGLNLGSVWLLAYLAAVFATEERRARAAVLRLSVTDPLTGVFNRAQIYTVLEQEIRRTRRSERGFCLLMIDLDGLKAVNDSLGHHRGDEVLRALAGVITRSIRAVDTAARYGGDEFVVLLPETDPTGAFVVAEKIRAGAEELNYTLERNDISTSVSIGLVYHPDDGATADELMIAADRAMYASKSQGKNQISSAPPRGAKSRLPALPAGTAARSGGTAGGVPVMSGQPGSEAPATESAPAGSAPRDPRPAAGRARATNGAPSEDRDEELDPGEARRRISQLSYDSDHQVRRAMDAFLSGRRPVEDEERDR